MTCSSTTAKRSSGSPPSRARTLPGAWTRPFGNDRGETDDHLHIDFGFVVSVPRDAPVERLGLTTPASETCETS